VDRSSTARTTPDRRRWMRESFAGTSRAGPDKKLRSRTTDGHLTRAQILEAGGERGNHVPEATCPRLGFAAAAANVSRRSSFCPAADAVVAVITGTGGSDWSQHPDEKSLQDQVGLEQTQANWFSLLIAARQTED
jgi:hypothetical protein